MTELDKLTELVEIIGQQSDTLQEQLEQLEILNQQILSLFGITIGFLVVILIAKGLKD